MLPATLGGGIAESSKAGFRHYGRAAAWTGTPPASSPPASSRPASPEPRVGKSSPLCGRAWGPARGRRRRGGQSAEYPEDVAGKPLGAGHAALTGCRAERRLAMIGEMPGIRRRVAYLRFREGWANRLIAGHLGPGRARRQSTYPMRAPT